MPNLSGRSIFLRECLASLRSDASSELTDSDPDAPSLPKFFSQPQSAHILRIEMRLLRSW